MYPDTILSEGTELDVFVGHAYVHLVLGTGQTISLRKHAADQLVEQLLEGMYDVKLKDLPL